jgi:hypothetical protein
MCQWEQEGACKGKKNKKTPVFSDSVIFLFLDHLESSMLTSDTCAMPVLLLNAFFSGLTVQPLINDITILNYIFSTNGLEIS